MKNLNFFEIDKDNASPNANIIVVEVVGANLFSPASSRSGNNNITGRIFFANLQFLLQEISIIGIFLRLAKLLKS